MNDPSRPSLLERLSALILREPGDRAELTQLLRSAYSRNLLDADALSIIEGALHGVGDAGARHHDPARADGRHRHQRAGGDLHPQVIATAHSRFPVIDQNRDDVIGVLLAKDLLRHYAGEEEFNVREMLRPAVFVPESKRLNVLLREFRASRNHMAIVVDEYGGVAGLVTIEDVLEQIVGDIEDEYDFDEASDNILPEPGGRYRVKALTQIADFNAAFGTEFSDEEHDTVGGLVIAHLGRLPKRGESVSIDGLRFQVLRADSRRVYTLLVDKAQDVILGVSLSLSLAGAATVLAFAPFELQPLALLSFAVLVHLWIDAPPRRCAWLGFLFGLGFFGAGVSWVYVSLHSFGGMPAPLAGFATLGFCAFLALFPAAAGWLQARIRARRMRRAPAC